MKEILLTSSALILSLLALRRLFRKALSRRAQYALWGLVLLRLLVPVSLPAADFSLLTAAKPVTDQVESLYIAPESITAWRRDGGPVYGMPNLPQAAIGPATPDNTYAFAYRNTMGNPTEGVGTYRRQILLSDLLPPVWYGGMAAMACWLVLSNLLFWRKLRKARIPYPIEGSSRQVYLVEAGLPSPCLFGLFRPAVYLTPAALQSPDSLRHVLAHEETHARHLDPLWSLLRGICLTVYWFDPLVWWAALASRTDCELACDEGALRRLGEAERVPYGRTLLSLIPVRKAPANPLLSATTMTAGTRQLKDRITRVAENPVYLSRALFAAAALAALVCAVTFTGAKKPDHFRDVDQAVSALAEELENYGGSDSDIMSKLVVYTPENPPEYFDLEDGELLRVHWGMSYSLSSSLSTPMGWLCSLYRVDLEPDYLPRNMEILGSDGQYQYGISRPDWAPEIKRGRTEGMSLMNQVIERVREAVLSCESLKQADRPDWNAAVTIPLDGLEPYEPQAAPELPFPYGYRNMLGGLEDPDRVLGDYGLMFFEGGDTSMGGEVFAGVQHKAMSSWPRPFWSFRPGAGGKYSASLFRNLLGHNGFRITYNANDGPRTLTHEYYYLNEKGWPVLLARVEGYPQRVDLDGDGADELASNSAHDDCFFFRRDGKHYRADLRPLLWTVSSTDVKFFFSGWDPVTRSMPFRASVYPESPSYAAFQSAKYRTLYFDGENLLVYNDQRNFSSHILNWPDLPAAIIEAALEEVQREFEAAGEPYDDWRITDFNGPRNLELGGETFPVCLVRYEFHTPEPQYSQALDSSDHWVDPCYPEGFYLVFRDVSPDRFGCEATYQFSMRQIPWPSAEQLLYRLSHIPLGTATLQAETSAASAATLAQMEMDRLMEADTVNMNLLTSQGGGRYDADPQAGNGPSFAYGFTSDYDWSYAEDPGDMPAESLLLMSPGGDLSLRFWPGSSLVLLSTYRESIWLRAEPNGDPEDVFYMDVFAFMRLWYDEAEIAGLQESAVIPDRGQSREKIVQLWADAHEGAMLKATPGSNYACTYVRNQDIWFPDWLDELTEEELDSFYPENTKGHERFAFAYSTVFVPENDGAMHALMAGNTGPYEGDNAPAGAQVYSRRGFMYLTEEGWRCDDLGTGW